MKPYLNVSHSFYKSRILVAALNYQRQDSDCIESHESSTNEIDVKFRDIWQLEIYHGVCRIEIERKPIMNSYCPTNRGKTKFLLITGKIIEIKVIKSIIIEHIN